MPVATDLTKPQTRPRAKLTPSNQPEVVALEEGELDPLGALAMGLSLDSMDLSKTAALATARSASRSSGLGEQALNEPATIKQQWKTHKDRVLAKLSDETFTIKASMLETNDIESELSYATTTEYQRQEDDDPATTTDGLHVIRKTRARLEQLERRHSSSRATSKSTLSPSMGNVRSVNGTSVVEISQREYVSRIKQMETDLAKAWQQNQKVLALRIAIKCVKQLSDTSSAPQLYPCAFVLATDVLDRFGQLVFDRIKARASEDENGQPLPIPLGDNFTSDEVNIHAKETCRNWFYKTACIRELLPRIYIEIALLKSYRFLCDGEFPQIVARLSNMIKGVGEPMVALYTRLYLAFASSELVSPSEKSAVISSLTDSFFTFRQYQEDGKLTKFLNDQKLSHDEYFALHSPAMEWLMKCCAHGANDDVVDILLAQYREYSDNSMVLKHLCEAFGAASYAKNPLVMLQFMRTAAPSQFTKCHLYSVLAVQLSTTPLIVGGTRDGKLAFLNEAWSSVTTQENIEVYMESAAAYMKLIVAHYTHREAMILLKDVVRHFNSATPQELTPKVFNLLGALIENVVYGAQRHSEFFVRVIPSGEFLSLMGMFRRDASVSVAKKVLQAFVNTNESAASGMTSDFGRLRLHVVGPEAAVAHTLFAICCRVHDALDSLSTVAERGEATKDIVAFIAKLGYARQTAGVAVSSSKVQEEEEALLMLYIDCRSAFYKLEPVKSALTKFVIALAERVRQRMNRSSGHSSALRASDRRRDFIKSCQAYAHITIPSITNVFHRLELLVLCAKAALCGNCLPQMEAFIKSAIMAVAELDYGQALHDIESDATSDSVGSTVVSVVDEGRDPVLAMFQDLIRVIAYAPSLVDDEPFYFVDALQKATLARMKWDLLSSSLTPTRVQRMASKCRIRIQVSLVQLYAMWGQPRFPNRIDGVECNDVLYGGDDSFAERVQAGFSSTLDQAIRDIESLDASSSSSAAKPETTAVASTQAELMLEVLSAIYPDISLDEDATDPAQRAPVRRSARSGAKLLRKCLVFAHDKLSHVTSAPQYDHRLSRSSNAEALVGSYNALVDEMRAYLDGHVNKRAVLYTEGARAAIGALQQALDSLTPINK